MTGTAEATGEKIRTLRERQHLTRAQLASKAGVTVPVLEQIELGQLKPTVITLSRLAKALGVPLTVLVGSGS